MADAESWRDDFDLSTDDESVNAAVTKYDEDTNDWTPSVLWPGDCEAVYNNN